MRALCYAQTNIGSGRDNNEDNYYCNGTFKRDPAIPVADFRLCSVAGSGFSCENRTYPSVVYGNISAGIGYLMSLTSITPLYWEISARANRWIGMGSGHHLNLVRMIFWRL